jgi:hypothetical protein
MNVSGYLDGAAWDMAPMPFNPPTEGCGVIVAGGCPNCSASVLKYDSKADKFVVDPSSARALSEVKALTAGGGAVRALSSWSIAGRGFVAATVSVVTGMGAYGWNWTSSVPSGMPRADGVAIFEVVTANSTFTLLRFGPGNAAKPNLGALLGPAAGAAGRASYLPVGACEVSAVTVPAVGATVAYSLLPDE